MDKKSAHAEREEKVLSTWKENKIFKKSLEKNKGKKTFVFYEGPPTANGHPGIHHLEARAFKDAIPRYKTMCGYHVRRKGGWDTHGLPVELQVEKELGLKSKKEIEKYGISAFNQKCKESVWKYVHEWEDFTDRMGYWVDMDDPYITYKPDYIESVWNIIKTADEKDLLYKDYKVVPWCPRCGTGLSSHELAQGYETVRDLSVYVKFKVNKTDAKILSDLVSDTNHSVLNGDVYLLAWTTTPWTLPGNVGLAVGGDIDYVLIKISDKNIDEVSRESQLLILAKSRLDVVVKSRDFDYEIIGEFKGRNLIGLAYEPVFDFYEKSKDVSVSSTSKIHDEQFERSNNSWKVYPANFVTTEDGTGIVHIAPMYGQDDFEIGTRHNLLKVHMVNDDGTFKPEAGFLSGKFVKDESTDVEIIRDLAHRGLLFHKEKHEHTYPFCWRCKTPLIYFARDSWYLRMSALRDKLVKENKDIHWEPEHIKEGRFGEWLREIKDWAISRERYWGTPLPIWVCDKCGNKKLVGSADELKRPSRNTYYVMRHGEAESNARNILNGAVDTPIHLTDFGKDQVGKTADSMAGVRFDAIYTSPFMRTMETAEIFRSNIGLDKSRVFVDDRLREMGMGEFEGRDLQEFLDAFPLENRFGAGPRGLESYVDIKKRMGDFLYDVESRHRDENILIVTHGSPAMMLISASAGMDREETIAYEKDNYIKKAEIRKLNFSIVPHNIEYELDLHRPCIDDVKFDCSCGGSMSRVREVMDVWFDSGAMPFAQDHYPFEPQEGYPADFISEAIDQTRGWFYTLHAIGVIMGKGRAYKNVICLGHILDAKGKKMSKSVGNIVDPWEMMNRYGADALRFWMYSVNQPGDAKSFDEKTVDEVVKKVFNLALNVLAFYKMNAGDTSRSDIQIKKISSENVLDRWIISRLNQLIENVTENLDNYVFFEPTRAIRDFVADLSQWYIRRSRDRFKNEGADKDSALLTTRYILIQLAKVMAPFTPFFVDHLYGEVGGEKESVHLEDWPSASKVDAKLLADMELVRNISSKGLESRMSAKINVRQPLKSLTINKVKLDDGLISLIKDEVNIKEMIFKENLDTKDDVILDTNITPELKEEGDLREFLRKIQDLRKEGGLSMRDRTSIVVPAEFGGLIKKYEVDIKKATGVDHIEIGADFKLLQ